MSIIFYRRKPSRDLFTFLFIKYRKSMLEIEKEKQAGDFQKLLPDRRQNGKCNGKT